MLPASEQVPLFTHCLQWVQLLLLHYWASLSSDAALLGFALN
jgi:hypothetical protein